MARIPYTLEEYQAAALLRGEDDGAVAAARKGGA